VLVSVVVPVYNEVQTVGEILRRLVSVDFAKEIILVDDCSTDGSRALLERIDNEGISALGDVKPQKLERIKVVLQEVNRGKVAAIRRGFAESTGDILIIQDSDLEYDPRDIPRVIQPILDGVADVVFGSRFTGTPRRVLYFWHMVLNTALTTASNMITGLNLTDMETCYKAFRREVLQGIELEENRFGIEPELTAKIARGKYRIYEVPISYYGRTYEEGKKIGWKDGVRALYVIIKYAVK
jgi:glycosyltransferase involved in cell wall biosynthesis